MSGQEQLNQAEIEKLLQAAKRGTAESSPESLSKAVAGSGDEDLGRPLSQEEIEKLLEQSGRPRSAPATSTKPASSPAVGEASESQIHPADLDHLFRQAEQALASLAQEEHSELPPGVSPFEFTEFSGAPPSPEAATLDLLKDVELEVQIELGRTRMALEDILRLRKGAVVTLDKLAGDPVDIYVNGRLVARGEVLVLNDNFCIRVAELVAGKEPRAEALH